MSKTRVALAAGLSIVLGLLVGLGVGALAWGDETTRATPAAAGAPAKAAGAPVLRIDRHVDAGSYVWVLDARESETVLAQGTNITLHLSGVQPYVHGISNGPGHQVVAIPVAHFFGTGADAYDFGVPYSDAAVVRKTGTSGAQPVVTQIVAAELHGDEVGLTLAAANRASAMKIAADTPEPISVVIDGGPLGPRR